MSPEEMKKEFDALYNTMANSKNVSFMHIFGKVHKEMMNWMIANKPDLAQEWIEKLESIRWNNYLTVKEAESIVDKMKPEAPWTREKWKQAMEQNELDLECEPDYNKCALFVTMSMIMSDSKETIEKCKEATEGEKILQMTDLGLISNIHK